MNKPSRLVEGRTELYVPIGDRDLIYVFPQVGPGNYISVGSQILEAGLQVPTGDLTAPLVHEIYCGALKDKKVIADARELVGDRWLWVYQNNLWTPEGVFSVKDRNAKGLNEKLNEKDLKQRLVGGFKRNDVEFSSDGEVAFAPRGSYHIGEIDEGRLKRDGFIIAQYGIEYAKLLAEAANSLKNKPVTFGLEVKEGQAPIQRVSMLGGGDCRLHVVGDGFGNGDYGCAFSVSAPTEGRAQKI